MVRDDASRVAATSAWKAAELSSALQALCAAGWTTISDRAVLVFEGAERGHGSSAAQAGCFMYSRFWSGCWQSVGHWDGRGREAVSLPALQVLLTASDQGRA